MVPMVLTAANIPVITPVIRTARQLTRILLIRQGVLPVPKTDVKTKPVITPFHAILARDIILATEHGSIAPAEPVPTAQKDFP